MAGVGIIVALINQTLEQLGLTSGGAAAAVLADGSVPMTGGLSLPDGSVGAPALFFTDDPGLGIYRNGASQLDVAIAGTSRLRVGGSTTHSFQTLDLNGNDLKLDSDLFLSDGPAGVLQVGVTSGATDGVLDLSGGGTATSIKTGLGSNSTPAIAIGDADSGIYGPAANQVAIATGGAARMTISTTSTLFQGNPVKLWDDIPIELGAGADAKVQGETTAITDGAAAQTVLTVVVPSGGMVSIQLRYTIKKSDGTDHQSESGTVSVSLVNKAGTITAGAVSVVNDAPALSAGTLPASTWSVDTTDANVELKVVSNSSLTTTTSEVAWKATFSGATITVP